MNINQSFNNMLNPYSVPFVITGGTTASSGGSIVVTYTASTTFTVSGIVTASILLVGGGGGGGRNAATISVATGSYGGRGGFGGSVFETDILLRPGTYNVIIGSGGIGKITSNGNGDIGKTTSITYTPNSDLISATGGINTILDNDIYGTHNWATYFSKASNGLGNGYTSSITGTPTLYGVPGIGGAWTSGNNYNDPGTNGGISSGAFGCTFGCASVGGIGVGYGGGGGGGATWNNVGGAASVVTGNGGNGSPGVVIIKYIPH